MKDFLWTSPAFFISMRHVRPNSLFHRSCDSFRYSRSELVTSPLKQAAFYQNPFWGRLKLICRLENGLLMELKTQTNLNESLSWFPGPPVRFFWSEFFGLWTGPARIRITDRMVKIRTKVRSGQPWSLDDVHQNRCHHSISSHKHEYLHLLEIHEPDSATKKS